MPGDVDVPTFVGFLMDIASPSEVVEYAAQFLGDSQRARKFAHSFIERRVSAYEGSDGSAGGAGGFGAASVPDSSWQQQGGKGKGKKKKRTARPANELLNFSVGAPTGPNRGEIDFGN